LQEVGIAGRKGGRKGRGLPSFFLSFLQFCNPCFLQWLDSGHVHRLPAEIIQESITLLVFTGFAYSYMGEALRWNTAASLACLIGAVAFAFWHA
jgi:uncharacterized protein (DUF486 family)